MGSPTSPRRSSRPSTARWSSPPDARMPGVLCHACYAEPGEVADCAACHGTGRATSMPLCADPWNEVVPGLWQGGHDVRSQSSTACVVGEQFDLVVSLATRRGHGPADGVEHL